MFTEPLAGWRLHPSEGRGILLQEDYRQAEMVVLVMDNLNTYSLGSLYNAWIVGLKAWNVRRENVVRGM